MRMPIAAALLAILTSVITVAAGRGRLGPNSMMGIRTMATQRSDETWQAAHKAAGKLLVPVSIAVLLGCLAVFSGMTSKLGPPEVLGSILLGVQLVAVVVSAFMAQHAANGVIDSGFPNQIP